MEALVLDGMWCQDGGAWPGREVIAEVAVAQNGPVNGICS